MVAASVSLESLCVNSIRMLAVDAVNKSNSGHPGLPMGCAPMGYASVSYTHLTLPTKA